MEEIRILVAMPAMADVISGAVDRPTEFAGNDWKADVANDQKYWWHWAVKTHAVRRLAASLNLGLDHENPTHTIPAEARDGEVYAYRRWQPWIDRGEATSLVFASEVAELRETLGDSDAGVLFTEVCASRGTDDIRRNRYLVAVNLDGTRCAYAPVADN